MRLLLATAPPGKAAEIARALVEEGLAACVSLVPGLRSVYAWKGEIEDSPETLLVVKAAAARIERLVARLLEVHPYEVPEVLCFAPEAALGPYLAWVLAAAPPPAPPAGA
jgi:periplasmic divalent cation tolerance protein